MDPPMSLPGSRKENPMATAAALPPELPPEGDRVEPPEDDPLFLRLLLPEDELGLVLFCFFSSSHVEESAFVPELPTLNLPDPPENALSKE